MKKNQPKVYDFKHGNITIPICRTESTKGGRVYASFVVSDYTTGKRKLWSFADLVNAKTKAAEVAEAYLQGRAVKDFELTLRIQIRDALEALRPTGVSISRAAELFSQAVGVLGGSDQLLAACSYWREHGFTEGVEPKPLTVAVNDFHASRHWISFQRRQAETSYLTALTEQIGDKLLNDVKADDVENFLKTRKWAAKTTNDFLSTLSGLYKHGRAKRWVLPQNDPTRHVRRRKEPREMVEIFEPGEVRQIFDRFPAEHPELTAFLALWFFSGIRKEEVGRIDWPQVNKGLATGSIELQASQTKTKVARIVPITTNLRAWLTVYNQAKGTIVPPHWLEKTKCAENRLREVTRLIANATGVPWKYNGPRHSFATFCFKLTKDAGDVVSQMGTSLAKFERHYWSKQKVVTEAAAKEYFEIAPSGVEKVVPLLTGELSPPHIEQRAASGDVYKALVQGATVV